MKTNEKLSLKIVFMGVLAIALFAFAFLGLEFSAANFY
jgi:hypothetical protein